MSEAPAAKSRRRTASVSVLHYLERVIEANDRRYADRFESADAAVAKAEVATERRLEGMNEFRQAMSDLIKEYMPRTEYENRHGALSERMGILSSRLDKTEGRAAGVNALWAIICGVILLVSGAAAAVSAFIHK